jgi:hypothetical protein
MKKTEREYENMANGILHTFEYMDKEIAEHVEPAYFVEISDSGLSAKFFLYYNDEDNKEDKHSFTLLEKDNLTKLISYIEDDYDRMKSIEPNF